MSAARDATRVILLRSEDSGVTWSPVTNDSSTTDDGMDYREQDAERIILMGSADDGVTWNPITDLGFSFAPTESLDPATATAEDIINALVTEGLLLPFGIEFILAQDGTVILAQDGTSILAQ